MIFYTNAIAGFKQRGALTTEDVTPQKTISPCVQDANGDILNFQVLSSSNSRRLWEVEAPRISRQSSH